MTVFVVWTSTRVNGPSASVTMADREGRLAELRHDCGWVRDSSWFMELLENLGYRVLIRRRRGGPPPRCRSENGGRVSRTRH